MKKKPTGLSKKIPRSGAITPFRGRYILRLFVAGATERSRQAVLHVRELCAGPLQNRCKLEVIDIYQQPALARANQIVATPTLIKESPRPIRRFIGNLVNIHSHFAEAGIAANETGAS